MRDYRLAVLGAGGVGKSAITVQFVQGVFIESYDPTIEDSYRKACEIDERPCTLEILDTAGVEQFTAMRELYIKNAQGFILVYSVDDESSLKELLALRQQIIQIKDNPNVPMVLVANKTDLDTSVRQVTPEFGIRVADSWGRIPFYETSAKYRVNIDQVFTDIVRQIMRRDSAFGSVSLKGHSFTKSIDESSSSTSHSSSSHHHYSRHKKHGSNVSNISVQASLTNTTPTSSIFKFKQRPQSKEYGGATSGRPLSRESRQAHFSPSYTDDQNNNDQQPQEPPQSQQSTADQEGSKHNSKGSLSKLRKPPLSSQKEPAKLSQKASYLQMPKKFSKSFLASSKSMPALRKQDKAKKSATRDKDCVIC